MLGLGVKELKQVARLSGSGEAAILASGGARYEGMQRRFGTSGAFAQYFGAGETRGQRQEFQKAWAGKNEDEILRVLGEQAGISGEGLYGKEDKAGGKDSAVRIALRKALAGGQGVQMGSLLEAATGDKGIAEQLEKKREARMSPSDRALTNIDKGIQTMNKALGALTPDAIGASVGKIVGELTAGSSKNTTPSAPPPRVES
jgi:hypothetical protein